MLDSLVPEPVTAQGPAQIGMTLRKIFVAFMVLLSLALSACGGDNKNPIAPTPVPAPDTSSGTDSDDSTGSRCGCAHGE